MSVETILSASTHARTDTHARTHSWRNTKYSQNVTCVCKNILTVECPVTTELFQKNGYDFNVCNNVRDMLYNTDAINPIVKWIVHSPVGNLV